MIADPIIADVMKRRDELDGQGGPFVDSRVAYGELQRRAGRVGRAVFEADWLDTRRQVLSLAAQCCRMIRDLGIATEADAVAKDNAQECEGK